MPTHDDSSRRRASRRRRPGLDGPLKVLFRDHALELLDLVGERGAGVLSARPVELHTLARRLDCVLELERAGEVYWRVVEFEARLRRRSLERFLLYCAQLMAQTGRPVCATVITLLPPAPAGDSLLLRVRVGGRTVNRWRFDLVRLWTLDARLAFERDTPGYLALVPLMRGGRDLDVIARASSRLARTDPPQGLSEAHLALMLLAGRYYTVAELARMVGRRTIMQSSIWTEARRLGLRHGRAQGRQEGRQEGQQEGRAQGLQLGRLAAERELCLAVLARHHPALVEAAAPRIDACTDASLLRDWILDAPTLATAEMARRLGRPDD